jgi:hemerythrin-like domain-containing protein
MIRHRSLHPLSRDHNDALIAVQRLRYGLEGRRWSMRAARDEFLAAWWKGLRAHFEAEDMFLLPHLPVGALRKRFERDHAHIRRLVAEVEATADEDPGRPLLARLEFDLHEHVRWEERELFPYLEDRLGEDELDSLESQLAIYEHA